MKWSSAGVFRYLLFSCVQVVAAQTPFSTTSTTYSSGSSAATSTTRRPATISTETTSSDTTTTDNSTSRSTSTFITRSSNFNVPVQVTTIVFSPSSALPSNSSTAASQPPSSESSLGTGSIIGISIAVSLAVIGAVAFFVWRFARQRSRIDNNSHPFPANNVGHPNTTTTPFKSKALDGLFTGSPPGGTSAVEDSRQRLAPQRSQDPLFSSVVSRLRPESRHTLRQVQRLTREVEQLRTEMAGMRDGQQLQQHPHTIEEPPPDYDAES